MAEPLPPPPFTPETLAERWQCSPANVRNLCRSGRLTHFTVGRGMYRIPVDAVEHYETGTSAVAPALAAPPRVALLPGSSREHDTSNWADDKIDELYDRLIHQKSRSPTAGT